MKYSNLIFCLFISILAGCNLFSSSGDSETALFGVWYKVVAVDSDNPVPQQRVLGWHISDESHSDSQTLGSFYPVGIEGNAGAISLIDPRFLPSYTPQIHRITSEYIIVDHFGYGKLASSVNEFKTDSYSISDFYLTRDTVKYTISSDQLTLDGRYYKGTYQRTTLGSEVIDPVSSQFNVTIDGNEYENLRVAETVPSAYMSRISADQIRIISRMGGQNVSIMIPDFDGPGIYIIGTEQAGYYSFGFDTLSPAYVSTTDSAGVITIDNIDLEENRITGYFEFTLHMDESYGDSEFQKNLTNGSFDLPVFQ